MVYKGKSHLKMDDLRVPLFQETSIWILVGSQPFFRAHLVVWVIVQGNSSCKYKVEMPSSASNISSTSFSWDPRPSLVGLHSQYSQLNSSHAQLVQASNMLQVAKLALQTLRRWLNLRLLSSPAKPFLLRINTLGP